MHEDSPTRCPDCAGAIRRPWTAARRLVLVAAWIYVGLSIFAAGLLGPTIVAVLPWLIAGGLGLIPAATAWATELPNCTECSRVHTGMPGPMPRRDAPDRVPRAA